MEDTAEKVEEGVTGVSPAPTEEPKVEGVKDSGESPASTEGAAVVEPVLEVAPKHATAEDRIKFLWKQGKEKETTIAERENKIKALEAELEKRKIVDVPVPKREDFDDDTAFDKAYDTFLDTKLDARLRQREAQSREAAVSEHVKTAWEPFHQAAAKLDQAQFPDLDKAVVGEGVIYSNLSAEFVRTSQVGPQLAYHFYKNPDLAERVARMPIAQQTQALLDLQAEAVKSSTARKTSSAPTPITPIGGVGGAVEKDPDKMDEKEWIAWRNKNKKIL